MIVGGNSITVRAHFRLNCTSEIRQNAVIAQGDMLSHAALYAGREAPREGPSNGRKDFQQGHGAFA